MATDKTARRRVDGVLLLDKPAGRTSTQALAAAKRLLRAEKAGHTGTLDPFATGLLPLCFGEASKFARFMLDAAKRYRATLKLGETSNTGDIEGSIAAGGPLPSSRGEIEAVLRSFIGRGRQTPPMHSAIKIGGVPLYRLARRGEEIVRPEREVEVAELRVVDWQNEELVIDCAVSKGTYIRVLAEDIGARLGCGAYLSALRRTAVGDWTVESAITLDDLQARDDQARDAVLLAPSSSCDGLPRVALDAQDAHVFAHGGWVSGTFLDGLSACVSVWRDVQFLGIGELLEKDGQRRLYPQRLMRSL